MPPETRDPLYELVSTSLAETRELRKEVREVSQRVDKAHLNGDTPALREMAAFWRKHGQDMVTVAESAPQIVAMVQGDEDRKTMWRQFKRVIRWDQGTGFVIRAVVLGLAAAITYYAVVTIHQPSMPSVHPPTVSAPASPHP